MAPTAIAAPAANRRMPMARHDLDARVSLLVGAIAAASTCLCAALALAQTQALAPLIEPIAAPDQAGVIALGPAPHRRGPAEQWENFHGERIVRNVTSATLTPVLPDPAHATGAAVIVAPGGAFMFLSWDNEGDRVARWLADHGVAAFILKYRTRETPRDSREFMTSLATFMSRAASRPVNPPTDSATNEAPRGSATPEALEDARAAVHLVRSRAQSWGLDPNRVGFVGFSAGAMTTLSVGLADDVAARPNFIAPIYGFLNARQVPADAPPMFVAVALDDPLMARGDAFGLVESYRSAHRPVEAHFYERGGHGFGMSGSWPASAMWIDEFYAWMTDRGIVPRARP